MEPDKLRQILSASLRDAGIPFHAYISKPRLLESCSGLDAALLERLGLGEAGGAIAAALPYSEAPASPPAPPWSSAPGPLARLARFARADWYAELGARLKAASTRISEALVGQGFDPGPPRAWRRFANSRLPERRLALAAGLGRRGRHGLVMLPGVGSAAVLGLLLCPPSLEPAFLAQPTLEEGGGALDPSCDRCGACVAACPTGALRGDGSLDRELCLQHWSSLAGSLPPEIEAAWGDRLYGCDSCQEACPRFKPDASASSARGLLGPGLPAHWLLAATDGELRTALRGSVLGMSWIAVGALRRSAALVLRAAAKSRNGEFDASDPLRLQ